MEGKNEDIFKKFEVLSSEEKEAIINKIGQSYARVRLGLLYAQKNWSKEKTRKTFYMFIITIILIISATVSIYLDSMVTWIIPLEEGFLRYRTVPTTLKFYINIISRAVITVVTTFFGAVLGHYYTKNKELEEEIGKIEEEKGLKGKVEKDRIKIEKMKTPTLKETVYMHNFYNLMNEASKKEANED